MSELKKVKDVSNRRNITSQTSRYYEEDGLLNSIRSEDYAYRDYDEDSIKGLEQIPILMYLISF